MTVGERELLANGLTDDARTRTSRITTYSINKRYSPMRRFLTPLIGLLLIACGKAPAEEGPTLQIATFAADVTIPIGHRCMGILPTKAKEIVDPLDLRGFILTGANEPVVFVAVDWF